MPATIEAFLQQVEDVARVLEESEALDLVTVVKSQINIPQLRLLIIGSIGSGRFALANTLLGQPKLLPVTALPKAPIGLHITYGKQLSVEVKNKDGLNNILPLQRLRTFLTSAKTDPTHYGGIEIQVESDLLRTHELQIESIEAQRSLPEWQTLLANIDYVLVVLNVIALLSEGEKAFIRDILLPTFGLERVAIVLSQVHLIPDDEHTSVFEQAQRFFSIGENQPRLFTFATTSDSTDSLAHTPPEDENKAIITLVREELAERHNLLKRTAIQRSIELCLTTIADEVNRRVAILSTNQADLETLLHKCTSQDTWLQERIKRAQHKIKFFINFQVQEEFFRSIEDFGNTLRAQLPATVMSIGDTQLVRQYLPGYIERLWSEFFQDQLVDIREKVSSEMMQIMALAEEDVKEFLGNQVELAEEVFTSFDPTPANMKILLVPKRAKGSLSKVATGLQLTGLFVLFTNIPLGLGMVGAGQIMRIADQQEAANLEKEAIISTAMEVLSELERHIKQQVASHFAAQVEQAQHLVADFYMRAIAQVRTTVEGHLRLIRQLQTKKEEVMKMRDVTLPELQQIFKHLVTQSAEL